MGPLLGKGNWMPIFNNLRRQERYAAMERDAFIREYQGRIAQLTALETQSNHENSAIFIRPQDQTNVAPGVPNLNQGRAQTRRNYDVPMHCGVVAVTAE